MNRHRSTDGPDVILLEAWRQRIAAFRIHPNQLSYMDEGKVVASGGFGQVKKATFNGRTSMTTSTTRGITVAVKTLQVHINVDTERLEKRFMREAYVWSKLQNDHIIDFLGFYFSCAEGKMEALLICPWMENGQSVRYVQQQRLPAVKRLQLLLDAAKGLQYLHSRVPPICHGDIKGSNVLIMDDGRAAICDFGLAQVLDEEFERLASQTIHRGTVRWTSPERLDDNGPLAPSSDVWSWAWLIWEFMTEKIPFHLVSNSSAVIFHIVTLKLPAYERDSAIAEVPTLSKLMQLCWQREPESRLQMDECIDRLEQILEGFEPPKMTGKGHLQQDYSEEGPSTFQPMMTTNFLAQTTPVTTFAPLSSYSPNVAEKSRALVEEIPGIGSLQLHLKPQPLSPMVSTSRPPRPANLRQDFPPTAGQDSKTYAGTASDSSNEQPKRPIPDLPVKIFSANATDVQPSSSRPNPFTSSTPTRSSSGAANQAPRNGSKRLTKPLLPSSERKTQQRNGHNEELWDWDIVSSPAPLETPLNASESDSSRPMNSDVTDLRDQQIDYILRTLRRLESSQEQHSQRQRDISNYLTRFNRWISEAPVFGSPYVSYQGQPVPGYTGQPAFVPFPAPAQISPAVTGATVFEPPAQPFGIPGAPSFIVPGAPAPFIPPQAVGQPFGILPDQPSSIMENWPVPFIPPGVASFVTGQQPMPFIPQPVTIVQPATGPGSSRSSIDFYRPSSTPRTGHPIVIQQPPGPTGGIQPPAIIRIPSNRSDSRIPSPRVSQYTGVILNAPVARDPIIIQQPTGMRPLEGVADISDSRTPSPHVDLQIGVALTDSVERHPTIMQLPPVSPDIQPPTIIRIGDSRMPSPSGSTGMRPPMVIHIPSSRSDSSTPSSFRARRISVEPAPAEYTTVLRQPTGIRPLEGVADISGSRTPSSRVDQTVLLVESGSIASHHTGQPSDIVSPPWVSASYPLASSAEEIGRNGRHRRARPIRTGLPFIRRFGENELQMHAFEGKDQATMGILSEAGRMIAVKPVNFGVDGGGHASESSIMNEFDDWLRLWGSLKHDNIAELVGSVFFNGIPSVITYRVASGNVEDYLKGNPQADRPNLLRQVAEGLKHLHTRPAEIRHSNLKPSNILVENGRVELGDIGILEFLEMQGVGAEMHGKTGDVRWTAPEVLEGPDRQWWSDLYSFGCLALFILRDEIPYSTLETDVAVSKAIYRGELPVNRDAASKLHPTWKLCWSHDPKRRPNMRTVVESLEDW